MCARTRGKKQDEKNAKALAKRQAARRAIEERMIEKEYELIEG